MSKPKFRPGEQRDLPELVRIYNHYVAKTHITFDIPTFTVEERRPWFESFSESGPYRLLVAEIAGQPVGYASSSRFRLKPAYDQSVETTIYLDATFVGRGIGPQLYASLLEVLQSVVCFLSTACSWTDCSRTRVASAIRSSPASVAGSYPTRN